MNVSWSHVTNESRAMRCATFVNKIVFVFTCSNFRNRAKKTSFSETVTREIWTVSNKTLLQDCAPRGGLHDLLFFR
jgi:hypothetical protein